MPQNEVLRQRLLEKANTLPLCPGVYLMRDKGGKVIYVGKSRKLKNRVSQYFQNAEKNIKTARMVSSVHDFDYYLCDTEIEALSLENTLIKQYTPKYNIRLKDAKSYPYIKLTQGEYPRLTFTRRRDADKAKYFGPYSGSGTAYALIELLRRVLRLPSCSRVFPRDIGKERPCIYYQMNRCCGVCTGKVSPEEYAHSVRYAADILNGKSREVRGELERQMYAFAEEERYEAAARCRDAISALDAIGEKQKVVASPDSEHDVVALYSDDVCSCVSVFYIRSGTLQDKTDYLYGADSILEYEDMTAFLCEHYKSREYIPSQILLAFAMEAEDTEMISAYLSRIAERRITVRTPERGQLKTLCDMVEKNAAEQAKLYQINTVRNEGTLARLAEPLRLETYPSRIEAYDISNLGKEHLTAGMIVCREGKFSKADYRSFRIRSVSGTTDDYASMRETLERRLEHLSDDDGSFSELPDLILLDGGRGHVSVVRELLIEKGLDLPVFGMVKDDYHKTRALCTDTEEISIAREQEIYSLIYRIQEEVHRFTVSRMENAKRKTLRTSVLTRIPGIGEAKAKKLLAAFGGMRALREADVTAIAAVSGISQRDAEAVFRDLHSDHKKKTEREAKT
ncbi:MAG: excinuclease ABC subunit UvrC [Clostridia bacterium]|nr:excinuclease ABC subunit UvrC [Clostridia bacterium]